MIFNPKNTKNKKVKVIDAIGRTIPNVLKYNTKTREAELYLSADNGVVVCYNPKLKGNTILSVKTKILGSKIIVDGKTY